MILIQSINIRSWRDLLVYVYVVLYIYAYCNKLEVCSRLYI